MFYPDENSESRLLRKIFKQQSRINLNRLKSCHKRHFRMDWNDTLTIVVNQGCHYKCKSCFRTQREVRIMDEALLNRTVNYASGHFHSVSITGGEPTECIEMIVNTAKQHPNMRINITTNGEAFNNKTVESIGSSSNIYPIISLNGIGEIHDFSRHPGSFNRVLETIQKLSVRHIPFGILTVVNRSNVIQLLSNEFVDFVDRIGACTLEFFQYYPIGDSALQNGKLMLSSEDMDSSLKYRSELARLNPYGFRYRYSQANSKRCHRALQIFIDGSVSFCPFSCWGFDKISTTDSDEAIKQKLNRYNPEWKKLTAQSPAYCPLQSNTKGYIEFFSEYGLELFRPTGILNKASDVHNLYCYNALNSEILNPGVLTHNFIY